MEKMYVWVALYCDCIYESAYEIISIHTSAKGAYKSMRKHLVDEYNWKRDAYLSYGGYKGDKINIHQSWKVKKYEVKD